MSHFPSNDEGKAVSSPSVTSLTEAWQDEVRRLQGIITSLTDRIAVQSDILTRRAEVLGEIAGGIVQNSGSVLHLLVNGGQEGSIRGRGAPGGLAGMKSLGDTLATVPITEREERVIRLLESSSEPLMGKHIASALDIRMNGTLHNLLAGMRRKGLLSHTFRDGYSLPGDYKRTVVMSRREVIDCDGCAKSHLADPVEISVPITPRTPNPSNEYVNERMELCAKCASEVIRRLLDETRDWKKNRLWVDEMRTRAITARTGIRTS